MANCVPVRKFMLNNIEPYRIYKTAEAANLLRISESLFIKLVKAKEIFARKLGKGHKVIGTMLIKYIYN